MKDRNKDFQATFVASDRGGVMASERVDGRIAFPSRDSKQPQAGETWIVSIAGENPRKTVFFLACKSKVEGDAKPAPAGIVPPHIAKKTSRLAVIAPVQGTIREQAAVLVSAPKKSSQLADLALMVAQSKADSDSEATLLRMRITRSLTALELNDGKLADVKAALARCFDSDKEAAQRHIDTQVRIADIALKGAELKRLRAKYASLCGQAKRAADEAKSGFEEQARAVKATVDSTVAAIEKIKEEGGSDLKYPDDIRLFTSDWDAFDRTLEAMQQRIILEGENKSLETELATHVCAYRDRLASLMAA